MKKIGFIGLGAIGMPIAENIVKAGYSLLFHARKKGVIEAGIEMGGEYISDITELGKRDVDCVILFVNNYEQCNECLSNVLETMRKGVVVIGSTISPEDMALIEEKCTAVGVGVIAAPVTGGVKGAKEAALTIIMSGSPQLCLQCEPVLKAYGKLIINAGEKIGMAQLLKSLVQLLVGINTIAMSEVYTLGVKCGLDPRNIYETVVNSAGTSRIFENRGMTVIERNFEKRGTIDIINKDLGICADLALKENVPLFLGSVCRQLFSAARNSIDPEEDFSAIIKLLESMSNINESDYRLV